MSRQVRTLVVVLVLLGAGWALWTWWFSEERAIRNRLSAIAETLTVASRDSELARLARVMRLRNYLAEDIHVRWDGAPQIDSRDMVLAGVSRWTPPADGVTVEFVDVDVTLGADKATAHATLTANVSSNDPGTGERTLDAREGTVGLKKLGGEWVIAEAELRGMVATP